ncbi:cyclopropane mycolic acid synthase 3 domain protein [Mycobacterium kansasii 662]|uniref:Cyclopropane mycolic acid synthase 3 domain protein n=1 Tax=Mycobacterium kansasii 662 TaxID=1299326 RepID=X7XW46_MYCKA|nr:cyclopropane mycolic acid synthase 3 domain protein [Mycobacterium kansasii 662]
MEANREKAIAIQSEKVYNRYMSTSRLRETVPRGLHDVRPVHVGEVASPPGTGVPVAAPVNSV